MAVVLLQARGIWVNLRVGKGSTSTFAKVTHAPYDYIFLGEPIELEIKALIIIFDFHLKHLHFFNIKLVFFHCQNGLSFRFSLGFSCGFMACILFISNACFATRPRPQKVPQHFSKTF